MSKVPLKYVASMNSRALPEDTDPEFEFRYVDISAVGRGELAAEPTTMRFKDAPSRARRLLDPGDTIVSTVRTYLRAVWPASGRVHDLVASTGFAVVSPHGVDPGYLSWWLRSDPFIEQVVARSVGVSYPAIAPDQIGEIPIRIPPAHEQRAIADYLDTETARIDALIAKKQQLILLSHEQAQAALFRAVGDWQRTPSRTLRQYGTHVLTGPFGTVLSASEYVDGGIPLVNPTHIKDGRIVPEVGVTVPEHVAQRIARHRLRTGDLVLGRKGDVGRSALATLQENGWVCGSDSIAVRCGPELDSEFLAMALRIDLYRQQLARMSSGAMVLNVNEGTLLSLELPDKSCEDQRQAAKSSSWVLRRHARLLSLLGQQIEMLVERRQALITAAVTGDLAIPGAAA